MYQYFYFYNRNAFLADFIAANLKLLKKYIDGKHTQIAKYFIQPAFLIIIITPATFM